MSELVELGYISAAHGIKGWIKVVSFCEPRSNIFAYKSWVLKSRRDVETKATVTSGQENGKTLIAHLKGCNTRNEAEELVGTKILVPADLLPALDDDEFYWRDLLGALVETTEGECLGTVTDFMETGANDVLVVKHDDTQASAKEHLIPFVLEHVVKEVDLDGRRITVDWDTSF